jgi:hypothetical protein
MPIGNIQFKADPGQSPVSYSMSPLLASTPSALRHRQRNLSDPVEPSSSCFVPCLFFLKAGVAGEEMQVCCCIHVLASDVMQCNSTVETRSALDNAEAVNLSRDDDWCHATKMLQDSFEMI